MVKIKALGETQDNTGDACGAFCIAAIASGMELIGQKGVNQVIKIQYEPGNKKVSTELNMQGNPVDLAKQMYTVTGNFKTPQQNAYEYTNTPDKNNKNSVSGLALVASKIGMDVKVNILDNCKIKQLPIYSDEEKLVENMNGVTLNDKLNIYTAPDNNSVQLICVNEPNDDFAHWIALDSEQFLYDPRYDKPEKEKFEIDKNTNIKTKDAEEYEFSGLWITLSKK
ncbi:MAG: hypothetical protein QNJ63_26140 [Calothrix sp. MO_192.B10]|nr:hypothetical protein [Calothrix sp. MO_192.B10]